MVRCIAWWKLSDVSGRSPWWRRQYAPRLYQATRRSIPEDSPVPTRRLEVGLYCQPVVLGIDPRLKLLTVRGNSLLQEAINSYSFVAVHFSTPVCRFQYLRQFLWVGLGSNAVLCMYVPLFIVQHIQSIFDQCKLIKQIMCWFNILSAL